MSTHVKIDPTTSKRSRATRQLEILRCLELADRVAASEIAFLDAIDRRGRPRKLPTAEAVS